jgi:hypothetical protein
MRHPRIASLWLSHDMARALATMCPPLKTRDVVQAADKLTARIGATYVVDHLLRQGADLMQVRRVVETLGALREARALGPQAATAPSRSSVNVGRKR